MVHRDVHQGVWEAAWSWSSERVWTGACLLQEAGNEASGPPWGDVLSPELSPERISQENPRLKLSGCEAARRSISTDDSRVLSLNECPAENSRSRKRNGAMRTRPV